MRFSSNSQLAKLGSISTFKSVNCTRNEAWPIQVIATSPYFSFGNSGCLCWPTRGVKKAFQTISRKKVRGLKALEGVKSLKDLGSLRRARGGRKGLVDGFVITFLGYWRCPCFNKKQKR